MDAELLTLLAPFIPVTMAMGGNVGLQAATVSVRQLATGGLDIAGFPVALWREARVGIMVGLFFGFLLSVGAAVFLREWHIVAVAGTAILCSITVSAVLGFAVPILFHRLSIDPALASGPLVTTINDVITVILFFTLANYMLTGLDSGGGGDDFDVVRIGFCRFSLM